MVIEDENLTDALRTVAHLAQAIALNGKPQLWTAAQIAEWMQLHEKTVRDRVVTAPTFPAPARPCGDTGERRWFDDEVIEWMRKNRGKMPRPRIRKAA